MFPKEKVYVGGYWGMFPVSAYFMLGLWFVIQLVFGSISLVGGQGSGVAFWAHVGGFAFGFIVTYALKAFKILKV